MAMLLLLLPALAFQPQRAALLARNEGRDPAIMDVLKLLQGMRDRTNAQIEEDKTNWNSYTGWSDKQESDKNAYTTTTKSVQLTATSTMTANQGSVATLDEALGLLQSDIGETTASLQQVTQMRTQEHALHQAELSDLQSTINSVNKAITILSAHQDAASMAQVKQEIAKAMELAALQKVLAPAQQKSLQELMLQQPDASTDYGSYSSQVGGSTVVETLKSVRSTLMENKQASIDKENDDRRSYETTKRTKEDELARMKSEQTQKTNQRTEANAAANAAKAAIQQCDEDLRDAADFLQLLSADRGHFQQLFNERLQTRNTELSATQAAIDVLQKVSLSLTQLNKRAPKAGLLQATSTSRKIVALADKLEKLGKKFASADLMSAGTVVRQLSLAQTKFDPTAMEPVKEMLRQLIDRLEEELSAEMSHKEWCDTEKATSKASKTARESLIDALQAEIPQLETQIASLTSEINFLATELTSNHQEVEAAKALRMSQKQAFDTSHEDHNQVIDALTGAIEALSSASFSLVQTGATKAQVSQNPFGASNSEAGAAGDASSMLTDLLNKYSTARAQMASEESQAVKAHDQFLEVSETFRMDTEQTKQSSTSERRLKENRLADARDELENAGTELQQVTQYIADLAPSCDDIRVTFEERKKRREAEIAALKETLEALGDLTSMGR
jgi:uncharacterized small protein (DUF1192 family)